MHQFFTQSLCDYDNEVGAWHVRSATLTAANFDAQATLRDALSAAVVDITVGTIVKQDYGNREAVALGPDANEESQRELKWLVQYHDNTTLDRYSIEIPCADVLELDPNDRAHADIGDAGHVDAFVTAFEAYVLSKAGNAVTVDEITLVGRNI